MNNVNEVGFYENLAQADRPCDHSFASLFILSMMFINVNIKESKIVDDMAGNTKLMIAISDLMNCK